MVYLCKKKKKKYIKTFELFCVVLLECMGYFPTRYNKYNRREIKSEVLLLSSSLLLLVVVVVVVVVILSY